MWPWDRRPWRCAPRSAGSAAAAQVAVDCQGCVGRGWSDVVKQGQGCAHCDMPLEEPCTTSLLLSTVVPVGRLHCLNPVLGSASLLATAPASDWYVSTTPGATSWSFLAVRPCWRRPLPELHPRPSGWPDLIVGLTAPSASPQSEAARPCWWLRVPRIGGLPLCTECAPQTHMGDHVWTRPAFALAYAGALML